MRCVVGPMIMCLAAQVIAGCPVPVQNTPSQAAKQLAIAKLGPLLACKPDDPINDQSPCNTFASKGLEAIYGVIDFKTGPNQFMSANKIHEKIKSSSKWKAIGTVFNVDNGLCAQSASNAAMPVVAVMTGNPHGHIALVTPGEPQKSGTWNMLVPMSASFFYKEPSKAYLDGPLSKAFGPANASNATYYYRLTN